MSEDEKNVIRERSKNRYKNKQIIKELVEKIYRNEILPEYNIKDESVCFW